MTGSKLLLQPGAQVEFNGRRYTIRRIVDFDTVLIADNQSGDIRSIRIEALQSVLVPASPTAAPDLTDIPEQAWTVAQERFEIIRPLLDQLGRTRADVSEVAKRVGLSVSSLYKWLNAFESEGRVTALLPRQRSDVGASRLPPEVEAIIKGVIEDEYLTKQKKRESHVCRVVRGRCLSAGLTPPHNNTVRARIAAIAEELKIARRKGHKVADSKFSPIEGSFPGADWPLAVVLIDHTKLDIILVDDILRRPIGRPWITLAIDGFSRMVPGFYISFDPPGALATGLCIAHAVLPKDSWLAKCGVAGEWPCWGLPKKLHLDNAKEFRGAMLERACRQYGIDIEWRPVARPHFGGYIERLLGTFSKEIHALPGTTFSNPRERGEYESEAKASLTLSEFEAWMTTYIVQVYHQRVHSSLDMPPVEKYREGLLGTGKQPGTGLPDRIVDQDRLRLDFMPFEERTVQDYGVVIDEIYYWHDVLRPWIGSKDGNDFRRKRKLTFRRDPRDISVIWFYDPEVQTYFSIPYRDTSHPPISVWELREAKKVATRNGADKVNEQAIFDAYERMREIENDAKQKTKTARRAQQRRALGIGATSAAVGSKPPDKPISADMPDDLPQNITPFDEMDDLS